MLSACAYNVFDNKNETQCSDCIRITYKGSNMTTDNFFHKFMTNNTGKRVDKWEHYFAVYERHLSRFRNKSPVMLEIGVFGGGSLAMWREYFGPGCKIIGLDINPDCKAHEAEDIEIFIGSQDDEAIIATILAKYGLLNVVIDDGSHRMDHMKRTFELLYPKIDTNAAYIVEDTHTCYWPRWGGGYRKQDTFQEFSKDRTDDLNAAYTDGELPISTFSVETDSIAFYDSMIVFEKRPQTPRRKWKTGYKA